ncbi:hypothetical protein [Bacillus sp. FDAARGOS_1420]|nr:hypothetical protein [Bacillus sp. FDAARGOS_1420]
MNAKEMRIQIINIQEQHCRGCEYLFGSINIASKIVNGINSIM